MPMITMEPQSDTLDWLNMLIYGPFGSGKTVLAATAELCKDTQHVLFIDAEGGTKSLRDAGTFPDVFRINTFKEFNQVYEFARNHAKLRDIYLNSKDPEAKKNAKENLIRLQGWLYGENAEDYLKKNSNKEPKIYRTLVIDSLTEVQKYIMYDILGVDINTTSLNAETAMPQFQHWGKNSEKVRLLVRAFRDIPMHTIFCCLDQTVKDERDGSTSIKPSLPGKLPDEVCGFLDIVGYMHVKEGKTPTGEDTSVRFLQVQPAGKYNAKSRYKALGNYVQEPTIGKIIGLIKNTAATTAAETNKKVEGGKQ